MTITGSTSQNSANGYKDSETYTFKVPVEAGFDASSFEGKVISVAGIQEVKKSKIISVDSLNKISIR